MSVRENAGLLLLSRLAAALGWVPNRSLDEAVREMVQRFQIRAGVACRAGQQSLRR